LEELLEVLKVRYGSQQQTDISLSRFLISRPPVSSQEFTQLLNEATTLHKKNFMNIVPLTQVVINKAPAEIKPLLFTTAESVRTWNEFVKRAEEIA
jgi:hypothetical protein